MGMLGQGAFGEVFKARCLITGDEYAIKKTKKQVGSTFAGPNTLRLVHAPDPLLCALKRLLRAFVDVHSFGANTTVTTHLRRCGR